MVEKKSAKTIKVKKVSIIGVIPSFAFQRAKYCALELHKAIPQRFPLPEIIGLLELDWSEKLQEWRQSLGREYWCLRRPVAVFFDDKFIGSDLELIKLTTIGNILMENLPRRNMSFMKEYFKKDYITYLKKSKRIYCYLDICVDGAYIGTLTFQLYSDIVPRTCENFKTLCLGNRGPLLSYKGSRIHRIVKKGWLQGGDIQYKTGGGGFSIFCDPLEDECFGISHDRRGVLSMANNGRHQNGSQFFITLKPSTWMDTHYVAFGQLIEGVKALKTLENLETFYECPLQKVEIRSCGKLDLEDVEDVDATYKEEPLPPKKRPKIEAISEQVVRLIMEALTDALARKERSADVLDDGDVPSKMNLQLYFQGFYSLPESVLESTAKYLRNLKRELFRTIKPSATEIVEVITYDLLMAVLTRMTTLDDIRETIGHDLYNKMVSRVDMTMEMCKKSYVKRLIDQIVSTAESMVNLVNKKITKMKRTSINLKKFQERMQNWVQSFVLQETFKGDNYYIAERPVYPVKIKEEEKQYPKREGKLCCDEEKKKKEEELKAKLLAKFGPEALCCLGSKLKLDTESNVNLYDYFSTCRYDLKRIPKKEKERMPLLDLIEISRFKLRWMRQKENAEKSNERLCVEKKVKKWMSEVVYNPETSWLKDSVFSKDCVVVDHVEEIMYGAMTAGLLEMYYFMEEYLKMCGGKKQKLVTRTIYPEDSSDSGSSNNAKNTVLESTASIPVPPLNSSSVQNLELQGEYEEKKDDEKHPCTCGHPCCVCEFDPFYKAPPPSEVPEEEEDEHLQEAQGEDFYFTTEEEQETEPPPKHTTCASDETLVDINAILAEKISLSPEEIDIRSFKWLKPYILEEGCDLKTEFASQVHKWLDGDRFNCKGFISKQSLVTRASLLSLSFSLTELLKEDNNVKTEIKNFIYDLWDLYFEEMFKEAILEYPPDQEHEGEVEAIERETEELVDKTDEIDDECKKLLAETKDFDFDKYCAGVRGEIKENENEIPVQGFEEQEQSEDENLKDGDETDVKVEDKTEKPESPLPPSSQPQPPSAPKDPSPTASEAEDLEFSKEQTSTTSEIGNIEITTKEIEQVDNSTGVDNIEYAELSKEKSIKKKKSPIVVEELVDVSSGDESRIIPPYTLPFWVKFLTELTKQALGALAKVSRLPRRLYFQTESDMTFDDKMKEWFEFNAFNPQPTKGREIMDFISLHHRTLTNLEDTARSYLKKKKYSELINRCTRFSSADDMADEIVANIIDTAMSKTEENETLELFVSDLVSCAITSSSFKSKSSFYDDEEEEEDEYNTFDTEQRNSTDMEQED